ncbi:hypothetical protein ACP70R_011933 [Stipagrostis hirtigluma subsp. patula]
MESGRYPKAEVQGASSSHGHYGSHENADDGDGECAESTEFGDITYRCAVKVVHDVISRFDSQKRDLVTAIGFGGLLDLPPLYQINRKFAVWLLSKVDQIGQCIVLDRTRVIPFAKEDVAMIFGIPCHGNNVVELKSGRSTTAV